MRQALFLFALSLALPAQKPEPFNENVKYTNPVLRLWIEVKTTLLGPGGPAYLQAVMASPFPTMNAEVVSVSGRNELLVKIKGAEKPEALLRVSGSLPGTLSKPDANIRFSGTVTALRKEPYQLTFSVDAAKIEKLD